MSIRDAAPVQGVHPTYGALLGALQDGTTEWLMEIGEPTEEAIIWQPWPNGSSIGGQMLHIASVEVGWLQHYCLGTPKTKEQSILFMDELRDVDGGIWPTPHNMVHRTSVRSATADLGSC